MDEGEQPDHEVVETLDYDGTLAKLDEWLGREVSVHVAGPETDVALMHLAVEGTLGRVMHLEEPRGVGGVMVPIGEPRSGYDNGAHPSYLTMSRAAHRSARLERLTRRVAHGPSDDVELLSIDLGADLRVQVTPLAQPHDDVLLTADEAFRAAFHFMAQYYERERITPLMLMLDSMTAWDGGDTFSRSTSDPATWDDWMKSVTAALHGDRIPVLAPVDEGGAEHKPAPGASERPPRPEELT